MNYSASAFANIGHSLQPVISDSDAGPAETQALLVFHLGERAYGLMIEHVVQVIAMIKLTPVPQAEQVIEGVANIRGKIVPVLSARRHLGLPLVRPQLYTPIILLHAGERIIGLIVDEVADVIRLPAGQVTRPEVILPAESDSERVLDGVVYQDDKVIMVINPRCLLNPSQMRVFKRVASALPEADFSKTDAETRNPLVETALEAALPGQNGNSPQSKGPEAGADEQVSDQTGAKKGSSGNGRGKSRKARRNLSETLAGEIAGLAADLPPHEGAHPEKPVDSNGASASTPDQPASESDDA